MPPKKESIYDLYFSITQKYLEEYGEKTILFYKVGAFFEMYGLQQGSQILKSCIYDFTQLAQLNMSAKEVVSNDGTIVMAGFRDYSLDKYLKIATNHDYTVIVYDQDASDPKKIVRKLDAIISPGTYISYDTESSQILSNNVVCVWFTPYGSKRNIVCGLSSAHIFTGETSIFEYETPYIMNPTSFDEIERFVSVIRPSEVVVVSYLCEKDTQTIIQYTGLDKCALHKIVVETEVNEKKKAKVENSQKQKYINEILGQHYGEDVYSLCREFQMYSVATQSFCFLLDFLQDHNQNLVRRLSTPAFTNSSMRMVLANHTLKQLNIIDDNTIDGKQSGIFSSVLTFLNKCSSPMGKREFQKQMTNPVFDEVWLQREYDSIGHLLKEPESSIMEMRTKMKSLRDLEKIARQLVTKKIYPNTVYLMYHSIHTIREICSQYGSENMKHLRQYLFEEADTVSDALTSILDYIEDELVIVNCRNIESTIICDPIIRTGKYVKLDGLYEEFQKSKNMFGIIHRKLNQLMQQNDDKTEYVKIHETEKSGHSLQITKKRGAALQTILKTKDVLVFTDDFVIPIKDIRFNKASSTTETIDFPQLTALLKKTDQIKDQLEKEISHIFAKFLEKLEQEHYESLLAIIGWITRVDVLFCKTYNARKYNYSKPEIVEHEKSFFDVKELRHVLIEHIQENEIYVTNDLELSRGCENTYNGILIYGTNAVGKTSFIRALGICIIMAQSGMYVPCSQFQYKPYQAIYSRILGNDNIFKGLSTFAVEMSELRIILKHSDKNSLILGDELCSGTETESALSLFSAGLVELHKKESTFLFATHFHEITGFEEIQGLKHMGLKHMSVQYDPSSQTLIYDRKLKSGQGRRIYGLEVCKSLYMEQEFLELAYSIRNKYFPENGGQMDKGVSKYNAKKIKGFCQLCKTRPSEEVHHMSPQKDADENGFIGTFHKNHKANLLNICERCHDTIHNENKTLKIKKSTAGYEVVVVQDAP